MDSVAVRAKAAPNNLPHPLTSFVGREADLRSLKSLLANSRMVSLVGTGGAGKSRLAAELARSSLHRWPDGVWWIDLAPVSDVAGSVLGTLELPGSGPAHQVIASWLASKRGLLILDNCEHLVAACAAFCQEMLERCPQVSVLATSREPLGVSGEARWSVSSLQDPDALQLFEVRAKLASPGFKVARTNLASVSEICERLDRLPLAIEMAAARMDVMSEKDLLSNLTDRFGVLASGTRTAPERQQTMAATIDWSHRLLTAAEATLFRRLAVFAGGFTLEAAQAVHADSDAGSVLASLVALVQKSMVVADRLHDGTTRYRLLESHHDFAATKLRESAEKDLVQRLHYAYFSSQKWRSVESANFWSALEWAHDNLDDGGLALAINVADSGHSDHARARNLLLNLLDRQTAHGAARAIAIGLAARLTSRQADYIQSRSLADLSVAAARKLEDPQLIAQMLSGAGVVYHAANDLDAARQMYDEALSVLTGSGNQRLAIEVQNQLAVLATEQGQLAAALEMLRECVSFSLAEGDQARTARYLESLANVELGLGDVNDAAEHWHEGLMIFRELNDPFGNIWCIGGLALVAAARGDHERALRLAAVTSRMSREWSLSAWSVRVNQLDEACMIARTRVTTRKADGVWNDGESMSDARALDYALGDGTLQATAVDVGPLSRRELEVAALVAAGLTSKEIAERLFIAERTAEGHVERIRNKLGVRSRTEVATWAVTHGIAPPTIDKP